MEPLSPIDPNTITQEINCILGNNTAYMSKGYNTNSVVWIDLYQQVRLTGIV